MVRPAVRHSRSWKFELEKITTKYEQKANRLVCSYFRSAYLSEVVQPPVEMVIIGAPSLLPVSVRVMTNIRNESSLFDR